MYQTINFCNMIINYPFVGSELTDNQPLCIYSSFSALSFDLSHFIFFIPWS